MKLSQMDSAQIDAFLAGARAEYDAFKAKELKLDMSRGKPSTEQLDLTLPMLDTLGSGDSMKAADGTDCRNYGVLDGISEAKAMFAEVLGVSEKEIIVGGNSSLNMMYDAMARAMLYGVVGSEKPWCKCEKVKFLAPVPGYDRHFGVTESLGIEMINVKMNADGPDMDEVERLVAADESIKGIWCVPMYSNPEGVTYSDAVVKRFAGMKTAAADFRIFWDNAYCMHHLTDAPDHLLNILAECKKCKNDDRVFMFGSTSKISFPGAGVGFMAASEANLAQIKKVLGMQTIGFDKMNQLRHVRFFGNYEGLVAHMKKHQASLAPKFATVLEHLERELAPLEIATWKKPNGGYFVSVDTLDGCAKRVVALCKEAGVVLTGAGAPFPYGKDPADKNIRLAPTYPPVAELETAMELFCICVKIASAELLKK